MARFDRIVILTGAGISAESGISTFRDKDGIWSKVDFRDVATPEGFARNPQRVLDFYNMRRKASGKAEPNAGHFALAKLEREHPVRNGARCWSSRRTSTPCTRRPARRTLIHMHGQHRQALCNPLQGPPPLGSRLARSGARSRLRGLR
jgi:NAD-dependent deacetylase